MMQIYDVRCTSRAKKKGGKRTRKRKKNIGFPGESLRRRRGRGEVGTRDATDQDTEHNSRAFRGAGGGGGEGEGAKKVSRGRWAGVGSVRRLPRYATRARDVTGPVTRAPCAPDHVSCHALAAPSLPFSFALRLSFSLSSPPAVGSPFSSRDYSFRARMYAYTNSLLSLSRARTDYVQTRIPSTPFISFRRDYFEMAFCDCLLTSRTLDGVPR